MRLPCPSTITCACPTALPCSSKRTVALPEQAAAAAFGTSTSADGGAGGGGGVYFDSNGVEKAVLLARYTDILHDWWV